MSKALVRLEAGPVAPVRRADNPKPYLMLGLFVVLLLAGGLGSWSVMARLSGAVITPGTVTVESNRRTVQHLDGGIVKDLLVRDGDVVKRGQVLLRLDDTVDRANLAIVDGQLDELKVRRARLEAEYRGRKKIRLPDDIRARREDPEVEAVIAGQVALFKAGLDARASQVRILKQRIDRFREEISGLETRHKSKKRQIALLNKELKGLRKLHKQGYAPVTRILALERESERLVGEMATDQTGIARARNGIGEVDLQLIQGEREFRQQIAADLRKAEAEIAVLKERRVAAAARLGRVEITAPEDGTVLGLKTHTVGGVVRAGEPILDIVPKGDSLVVEVQVPARDVDKIAVGQSSLVRLSALNLKSTPEVQGRVAWVSADRITETRGNLPPHYLARIRMDEQTLTGLGSANLTPGMPAEVFIQTGERTALSYLLKPLSDSLARAFNES